MSEKQFLVSVANAYVIDQSTDTMVLSGKALLNSSIEQAMQNTEIFGGKSSQLVFEYNYQKMLNFTIEDTEFNEAYICLQNNTGISEVLADFYTDEIVELDASGKGELSETPVGNVYVKMDNNQHITITPNGKEFTVSGMENRDVFVAYRYKSTTDEIVIDATLFPKTYKLVLNGDIFTNNGKYAEIQITVPKFKPDGALTIGLEHDGVASSNLNGKSMSDNKSNYAYINIKRINQDDIKLNAIAATPSEVQLDTSITDDLEQLTVYGIRGGIYNTIIVPVSELTFTSDDSTVATVSSTGLVELGSSATSGDSTIIRVTNGTHTDILHVDVL